MLAETWVCVNKYAFRLLGAVNVVQIKYCGAPEFKAQPLACMRTHRENTSALHAQSARGIFEDVRVELGGLVSKTRVHPVHVIGRSGAELKLVQLHNAESAVNEPASRGEVGKVGNRQVITVERPLKPLLSQAKGKSKPSLTAWKHLRTAQICQY